MEILPLIADVLANVKKEAILVDMCGKTLFLGDTLGNGKTSSTSNDVCMLLLQRQRSRALGSRDHLEE